MAYNDVKLSINNHVIKRCTFGKGSGALKTKHMEPSDLLKTYESRILTPIRQEQLDRAGLQMDQDRFVCPKDEGFDLPRIEPRAHTLPPSPEKNISLPENTAAATDELEDHNMEEGESVGGSKTPISIPSMTLATTGNVSVESEQDSESDEEMQDAPSAQQETSNSAALEESNKETVSPADVHTKCGCLLYPATLIRALKEKDFSKQKNSLIALRTIRRRLVRSGDITVNTLCSKHAKALVEAVQITSMSKNHQQLVNRVALSYKNIGN
jgi:hypothetical protein